MSMDLHIIHTIKNSIKYFKDNRSAFDGCFNQLSSTIRDKYFARLTTLESDLQVDLAFTRKSNKFPLVSVSLQEAAIDQTSFLGNQGTNGELTQLSNQQCRISIYSKFMDDIRILHRLIQCGLLLFKKSFFDIDYLDLRYVQSRDLEPIEMLTSDNALVYIRELIYNSTSEIAIKEIADNTVLSWEILPNVINGNFSQIKTTLQGTNLPQIPNNTNLPISVMDELQPFTIRWYNNNPDHDLYVKWQSLGNGSNQLVIIKTLFNTTTLVSANRYIPIDIFSRTKTLFNFINDEFFNNSPDSVLNTSVNLGIIDLITETLGLININTIGIGLGGLAVVDPVVTETGFIRVRPGEFFDIK
jgi:hypothetical protein